MTGIMKVFPFLVFPSISCRLLELNKYILMDPNQVYKSIQIGWNILKKRSGGSNCVKYGCVISYLLKRVNFCVDTWIYSLLLYLMFCVYNVSTFTEPNIIETRECNCFLDPGAHHTNKLQPFYSLYSFIYSDKYSYSSLNLE